MSVTPSPWSALSPLLDELLDLTGSARSERLAEIAVSDPSLAAELEKLMALEDRHPDFLSQPAVNPQLLSPQPDQEIGPYRLLALLGEGGMGQVWLAMRADGLYERRVALKLLRPGLGDAGLRARFTRERQILARLGHAHIARLLDAGISQDGQPYLALDYVRGDPITVYAQKHSLDVDTRLQLFAQVCAAVSHAHANLVVHRDLKPSNILVTPAGEVCLLDFGIAKLLDQDQAQSGEITQTGSRTFTLHYAAPEQLRGEVITTMTDVYSLGVVLYELLSDCKPYDLARHSDAAWEQAILDAEPLRPSQAVTRKARNDGVIADKRRVRMLMGDLDNIVLKAMSKQPEQRYPSAEALALDLRRYLAGQPIQARPQSLKYRMRKFMHRHALSVGLGAGIAVLLVVALTIVSWQASKAVKEANRAQAMHDFIIALFENTSSANAQGLDVRALLDAGVRRADNELAAQPRARAELLGLIARLRSSLGDDREALQLLDRQQELIHILGNNVPMSLLLDSAALRGRNLKELGRTGQCLQALDPMLDDAKRNASAYPLQVAEFFSQLGRCHAVRPQGRQFARSLFEEALQLRRSQPGAGALEAESEKDLALILLDDGKVGDAQQALREALQRLRSNGGERSALGVEIWRQIGAAYILQDNATEAEAALRQALDISLGRVGYNHPCTIRLQQRLADVLIGSGKLAEAERLLDLAQDNLLARWGRDSLEFAKSQSLRGWLALERDRPADAVPALNEAIGLWRRHSVLPPHAADVCLLSQAYLGLRQPELALESDRECLALLDARPRPESVPVLAALVQAALDHGDLDKAKSWLERMPEANPATPFAIENLLARSRLALRTGGKGAGAQEVALLAQTVNDTSDRRQRWQVQALEAAQQCRAGQNAKGQALRVQLLDEARGSEPEHTRLLRRLTSIGSACGALN